MLFNSYAFAVLVAATMAVYYTPMLRRAQVVTLVLASSVFYGYAHPWLLILLWASIAINTVTSQLAFNSELGRARLYTTVGVVANLLILGFFKYASLLAAPFLSESLQAGDVGHFLISIPLPVGISFFTFQGISLAVDAYKARTREEYRDIVSPIQARHWLHTSHYISFFPQLVAGPIVKSHEFFPQITPKSLRDIDWGVAFQTLVLGYFLKMVVADNLKDYTGQMQFPYFESYASIDLLAMLFGFSMQIFADFAGYSLIAIGVGKLFGYELPENFNFPYIASRFGEFWRRWHISLSTWLRDYLYVPLGGNRGGRARTYFNLFIVMFLGGLWHGAAWSYAVWGTAHGLALAVERALSSKQSRRKDSFNPLGMLMVFTFVTFAWLLFKLPNFSQAVAYVLAIANNWHIKPDLKVNYYLLIYSLPVVVYHLNALVKERYQRSAFRPMPVQHLAYGVMLFLLITNSGDAGAFIYFQF